jgi:hypothetical protein
MYVNVAIETAFDFPSQRHVTKAFPWLVLTRHKLKQLARLMTGGTTLRARTQPWGARHGEFRA